MPSTSAACAVISSAGTARNMVSLALRMRTRYAVDLGGVGDLEPRGRT